MTGAMIVPWLLAGVAVLCLWFGLRAARRRRLIQNLPTSKTGGVFIGLVELKGTAEAESPLVSHLAGVTCVHYAWQVQERWSKLVTETYRDSKGHTHTRTRRKTGWAEVGSGSQQASFYLKDDTGLVRVRPEGATLEPVEVLATTCGRSDPLYYAKGPAGAVAHSDHVRRFTEQAIPLHAALYVMGQAREREDVVAPEIAADPAAPLFLISTRSEQQVSRGLAWTSWLLPLLGLGLSLAAAAAAGQGLAPGLAQGSAPLWLAAVGFLMVWGLCWLWMAYNSLVELHQRVRQGWANVDVQLKRRADLIPALVRTVEGLRDYERTVHLELVHLRTQLTATPPGQPGPDPSACAAVLMAVIERYPDLRANQAFAGLHRSLVDTEQRIALARAYFNDIATFYNTRLEIVPDRFVASLAKLRPQPLLGAAGFERAPVQVALAL
jgi:hypothetical protein